MMHKLVNHPIAKRDWAADDRSSDRAWPDGLDDASDGRVPLVVIDGREIT